MIRRTDVYEAGDVLVVEVELPGIAPAQLRVAIADDRVSLVVDPLTCRAPETRRWHRRERAPAALRREIPLPRAVEPKAARASLAHGLLVLRLPIRDALRRGAPAAQVEDAAFAA